MKLSHIVANLILYGFLVYELYRSTIAKWDPWNAFVVAFVLVLAIAIMLIPGLHAAGVAPGQYPYDD
jgi:peptidoglycan biosynthesis protein MviN/MurJ (putative lipid II flippase)